MPARSSRALTRAASALPSTTPTSTRTRLSSAIISSFSAQGRNARSAATVPGGRRSASIRNNASGRRDWREFPLDDFQAAGRGRAQARMVLLDGAAQERTDPRPQRHQAPRRGPARLPPARFPACEAGPRPCPAPRPSRSAPGARAGAVRRWSFATRSPTPHGGARGIPDRFRADRGPSIPLPGRARYSSALAPSGAGPSDRHSISTGMA